MAGDQIAWNRKRAQVRTGRLKGGMSGGQEVLKRPGVINSSKRAISCRSGIWLNTAGRKSLSVGQSIFRIGLVRKDSKLKKSA
jgi:hypothetical protein